ncbi:Rmf/CrpP fold protein [Kitasatospora sp. NPDC004614]|uniref:Rmf/CrpP fold protein n=1 Tax=unclassified Kitasatospora TaxID=2633591 RepID=UPI0036C33FEF
MDFRASSVRAAQAGQQAARGGQSVTACPYGRDDLLRTAWLRGYRQGSDPALISDES